MPDEKWLKVKGRRIKVAICDAAKCRNRIRFSIYRRAKFNSHEILTIVCGKHLKGELQRQEEWKKKNNWSYKILVQDLKDSYPSEWN